MGTPKTPKAARPGDREAQFRADVQHLIPQAKALAVKVETAASMAVRVAANPDLCELFRELTERLWSLDTFADTARSHLGPDGA